jgi:NADPH-dependent curcumin reductase
MTQITAITLKAPIEGLPTPEDFVEMARPAPDLPEGGFLARTLCFSVDPGTRSRLSAGASYAFPLKPGEVIDGFAVAEVIETRSPHFAVGQTVAMGGGWADHQVFGGRGYVQLIRDEGIPLSAWIGVLGIPGMTSWFGLHRVGQVKAGDTVLISSAAGPVGATAGQLARKAGAARVVGIAGGPVKCAWLVEHAGFDAVVDYKTTSDLDAALRDACPKGVDVLFDNVGNAMIDRCLPLMRRGGRIVVSGQVADYNTAPEDRPGLKNTAYFIAQRLKMEGLVVFDDMREFTKAQAAMAGWIKDGSLIYREERFEGLRAAPGAFSTLFTDGSFGRRIIHLT